jgi:predicted AlkP superfamily phosphohydrolase/phosphomutase
MTAAPRVLVIGLDGASPDLVRRWADSGDLPVLKGLIDRGVFGPLRSTIPPVSPAAWSTFMTGLDPAGHGILGFRNLDARRYEFHEPDIVTSKRIAGRTFWDYAGAQGARVAALWVPVTYPPWPVNGLLVSGYPTPRASRSFGLPEARAQSIPPLTEDSAFFHFAKPHRVAGELVRLARKRGRAAAELIRRERFDLFVMVIGSIDRAQHDFWRHFDPASPAHDPRESERFGDTIRDTYRAADRAVGEMLAAAGPETTVFILSDHGGGPAASRVVHLNAWLREHGFLSARFSSPCRSPTGREGRALPHGRASALQLKSLAARAYAWAKDRIPIQEQIFRRLPHALRARLTALDAAATLNVRAIDWACTRAYRFPLYPPFEGISINLAGRQPQGAVAPNEYEALRSQLINQLSGARAPQRRGPTVREGSGEGSSGAAHSASDAAAPPAEQPIVTRVMRREDVYSGEHLERLPDLIVQFEADYAGGPGLFDDWLSAAPVRQLRRLSGAHVMDGLLIAAGPAIRRAATIGGASIADLAPTILYALGQPHPPSMHGRVLAELFDPAYRAAHAIRQLDTQGTTPSPQGEPFSPSEQAEIAEHLRALGYMD